MEKFKDVVYEHTLVKKMLHYVNVWFLPFRWVVNTYRGCEHNCVYCNARYTHEYLGLPTGEFSYRIIVKDNAAEVLDKEFSREKWNKKLTVNLATVTDPYQPAEAKFKITREVLNVFLKHHNSLLLTTKSDLVLRDLDILTEIASTGFLNVDITLPTLNEDLRKKIELNITSVEKRLEVIQKLHEAGITVGVTAIPLLPYITDSEKDIEELVKAASDVGADYVILDVLNFRGEARERFMEFLKDYDEDLVPKYEQLYQTNYCDKNYASVKRKYTNRLVKEYNVDNYDKMYSYRKKGKK
ncbi:MAG: radical SAM protein [Candidatus Freyarchaeum deiterrae]